MHTMCYIFSVIDAMRSYMIVCTKRFIMANNEPLGSTLKNCKGFAVVSKAG